MAKLSLLVTAAALVLALPVAVAKDDAGPAPGVTGGSNCCAQCGRRSACQQQVCQVVCEIKKLSLIHI